MENQDVILIKLVEGQARVEQSVKDLSTRLLGGDGQKGVLFMMADSHKELEGRVGALENKKSYAAGWIAGVGAVGGGILAWVANLLHHAPKGH